MDKQTVSNTENWPHSIFKRRDRIAVEKFGKWTCVVAKVLARATNQFGLIHTTAWYKHIFTLLHTRTHRPPYRHVLHTYSTLDLTLTSCGRLEDHFHETHNHDTDGWCAIDKKIHISHIHLKFSNRFLVPLFRFGCSLFGRKL